MSRYSICNKCRKKIDNYFDEANGIHIYKTLGYGSSYDGAMLNLDLCAECTEQLIEDCSLSPIQNDGTDTFESTSSIKLL